MCGCGVGNFLAADDWHRTGGGFLACSRVGSDSSQKTPERITSGELNYLTVSYLLVLLGVSVFPVWIESGNKCIRVPQGYNK